MFLLLFVALSGTGTALAQTSPPPAETAVQATPLTLPQTLTLLRSGPGWRGADLRYRSAELSLRSAQARAGLSVTVGADANAVKLPADSGETKLSATVQVQAAVSVLPWSPALEGVRSAERAVGRAAADLRATHAALTVSAVQAYWGARNAAASLSLAQARLALARRQLTVAQAQRTAGVLPAAGLLAREQALADAQAGERQARATVDLAARQLANLLGQSVTLPQGPAAYGPLSPEPRDPGSPEALVARALAGRAEVRSAGNDLASAEAGLRAAALDARLPDLTASVQYGQLAGGQTTAGWTVGGSLNVKAGVLAGQVSVPLRETGDQPTGVALALSGSLPVIGGEKRAALASAEVGVQAARLALDSARQSVDLEVRQRHAELLTALDTLASRRGTLRQATEAQSTARARLDAGLVTALDVEEADLNVRQAGLGADTAQIDAFLASLRLMQATTELDPSLLILSTPTLSPSPAPEARP